jgi:hypothetical protein
VAVWEQVIAGTEVKMHTVDHWPPHCHAFLGGRDARIDRRTLEILNPPPHDLPPGLRKGLLTIQDELLRAWERVHVTPPRGDIDGE